MQTLQLIIEKNTQTHQITQIILLLLLIATPYLLYRAIIKIVRESKK